MPPHKEVLGPALSFPNVVGFRKSTTVVGALKLKRLNKHLLHGMNVQTNQEREPFVELQDLLRGCVHGELRRAADDIAPGIAGSEGGRVCEVIDGDDGIDGQLIEAGRALVQPVVQQLGCPHQVGPLGAGEGRKVVVGTVGEGERQRRTAFPIDEPGCLPAANDRVQHAAPIQEVPSLADRQFVGDAVEISLRAVVSCAGLF